MILLLGVPLGVTALTGQWADAPIRTWAVVAVVFGLLGVAIYRPFQDAIDTFLSLHRVMVEEITYIATMLGLESRILSAYDYELYRLSPIDSVVHGHRPENVVES